jgi:hypothetical protein
MTSIFILGPVGVGKSTVAELLSIRTGLPRHSIDELRWKYYDEIGYDWGVAKEQHARHGFWGLYRYWKPFEAYTVKRLLEDFKEGIFDFGGSQSVYEDDGLFEQVRQALEHHRFVILLMPSPNVDESLEFLLARNKFSAKEHHEVNEHFVRHHSNYDLAKQTVYIKDKDPDQVCDEIHRWIKSQGGLQGLK